MRDPETVPSRFLPQARQASLVEHYNELRLGILQLHSLRSRVQQHMSQIPEFFNREAGIGRLRLRADSRTPDAPPYRLSWILMNRASNRFETYSRFARKPKWPYKRLSIHSSRELDSAIHWGLMDSRRSLIRSYHRRATTLNAVSKELTAALSGIRKRLGRFASREREVIPYLHTPSQNFPPDVRCCLWLLRGAILSLKTAQDELEEIATRFNEAYQVVLGFFPVFVADTEHRYGRLLWIERMSGTYYSSLTDTLKRRVGLSEDLRKLLTPYELERRSRTRALGQVTDIFKRIRLRVPAALKRGHETLTQGGYSLLADRPAPGNNAAPLQERRYVPSGPSAGTAGYPWRTSPFQSPHMPLSFRPEESARPIDTSPSRLTMRSEIHNAPQWGEKGMVGS